MSVSYTHLDVYKRQQALTPAPGRPGVVPALAVGDQVFVGRSAAAMSADNAISTVHLHVTDPLWPAGIRTGKQQHVPWS